MRKAFIFCYCLIQNVIIFCILRAYSVYSIYEVVELRQKTGNPLQYSLSAVYQTLLAMQERELIIVNTADTVQDDLMGDFVAIITSFAARLYGRRRAKQKTEQVLAVFQQNGPVE